jgi:DedD protein
MALFNFRKNADLHNGAQASAEPVESVEVLRKKTLHRLIGSAILVVVGVVGFSLVFDRQPRPIPVDIAISIPSRDGATPLVIGAPLVTASTPIAATSTTAAPVPEAAAPAATASASTVAAPASAAVPVSAKASLGAKEEIVAPVVKPAAPASAKEVAKEVVKPPVKEAPKDAGADKSKAEAERAKALLEGKVAPSPTPEKAASAEAGRFIVQVGAFADPAKARQTRLKVEKAGMKTYTHVAETAEGKRIRVRVGPFASRDEAEKAAKKLKSLDLPAAILTL